MTNRTSVKAFLITTAALGALSLTPVPAMALPQSNAGTVTDLVRQGDFWRQRGRADLADQAYNRALRLDPGNAAARQGLAGGRAPAATTPAPARPQTTAPQTSAPAATPVPARRTPTATPARSAQRSAADRAGEIRLQGYAALERGELATAASRFEQALASNERDADALGGLGIVRLRQDRFAEAQSLLERATAAGSNDARWAEALSASRFFAGLEQVKVRLAAGDTRAAQTLLTQLMSSNVSPDQMALAAVQLGDLLMDQGRYTEARAAYAKAEGHDATIPYKLAQAEASESELTGDPMRAEQAWRRALDMGGANDPWVRHGFASFLLDQNRSSDAAAIIQPLETLGSPEALYAAALFYSEAQRPAEALRLIRRLPEASRPAEMRALEAEINLADTERQARQMMGTGRGMAAADLLARYDTPTASPGMKLRLAGSYYALGNRDRAASLARSVAEQPGLSTSSTEDLVRILAQTGQDDLALQVIERSSGGARTSPLATRLYATLSVASADRLREDGRQAEAFEVLQSGYSLAPQDPAILVSLGRLYQSGELHEEATQVFLMALQRQPDNADALKGVAETQSAQGEHRAARDAYQRLLRLTPQDPEAYMSAARIEQAAGDRRAARRLLEQADSLGRPQGLPGGSAFGVSNPFRNAAVSAPLQPNPFAPDTLRASARSGTRAGGRGEVILTPVQQALAELKSEGAPRLSSDIEARVRSGEEGLSNLSALTATVKADIPVANGHLGFSLQPTVIDAGSLNRTARARFGGNPTAEALAIVAQVPPSLAEVDSQYAAGVGLGVYYENDQFSVDVGTTPIGFDRTHIQGGVNWRPRLGTYGALRFFGERRPVTDSVLSYSGGEYVLPAIPATEDSEAREEVRLDWGGVMKAGGGFGGSWERDGTGFYGDVSYHQYTGRRVADNAAVQMNLGAYQRLYEGDGVRVQAGTKLNYQAFDENLSHFALGHGGYFSPQSFISLALPVSLTWAQGDWTAMAELAPGYQTYKLDQADVFPIDPAAQGQLVSLKAENSDARAYFESESHSGFAFSGGIELWRRLGGTQIGGEARMNTFGNYDEYRMTLRLKQAFGYNP